MLLAFDTATQIAGVAVYGREGLLAESTWRAGRGHSEQSMAMAQQLLANLALGPDALTAVGVALGPGSWSGLRVGLSLAKGVAMARNLPILGVSSLETLAYPHQRTGRSVFPVIKLGRERFAVAEFRLRRSWSRIGDERNVSQQELLDLLPDLALVCGDVDPELAATITRVKGVGVVIPSPGLNYRRSGYLAELAWQRFRNGERDNLVTLEPTYLGSGVKEPAK